MNSYPVSFLKDKTGKDCHSLSNWIYSSFYMEKIIGFKINTASIISKKPHFLRKSQYKVELWPELCQY